MKKCLVLIFTLSFIFSFGQNAIVGNGFTCCWGSAGNSDYGYEYFDTSAGDSYISIENARNAGGNNYFRFGVGWGGTYKQLTITHGSDIVISPGNEYTLNTINV